MEIHLVESHVVPARLEVSGGPDETGNVLVYREKIVEQTFWFQEAVYVVVSNVLDVPL